MTLAAAPRLRRSAGLAPFSMMVVLWVVIIGVVAFMGTLVLGAFSSRLQSGDNAQAHALSRSAVSYSGMVSLMRRLGQPVDISRAEYPDPDLQGLLIITPTAMSDVTELKTFRYKGPRLLVLPKWATVPDPARRGWSRFGRSLPMDASVQAARVYSKTTSLARKEGAASPVLIAADGRVIGRAGPIHGLRSLSGGDWQPVIRDQTGAIIVGRRGSVLVLADPDLINNIGFAEPATAQTGLAMLQYLAGDRPVTFDVWLAGIRHKRNLLELVFLPPFVGVTLAMLLMALLIGVQAFNRFGPPISQRRAFALGKQGLADNAAALIRLARREHRMVEGYALLVRADAARAVGAPHTLAEADLDALLDRLAQQAGLETFSNLRRRAAAAQDIGSAMAAARNLYHWRVEMTRERR
ncbi:MAG: DUF4350 domain-containing protein [Caulobacter sp.]